MNTNLKKTLIFPAVIIAALSLSTAVFAQNNYVGIGSVGAGFDYDELCDNDLSDRSGFYGNNCDESVSGLKIYAGIGSSKNNFSLEFGYVDFGEAKFTETLTNATLNNSNGDQIFGVRASTEETLEFSSIYLALVGIFPVSESWDLTTKCLRLGLHSYDVNYSYDTTESISRFGVVLGASSIDSGNTPAVSDTDVLYGVGLQWHNANGFGVRGEWELFNMELAPGVPIDLSSLSFSIFKRF